MAQQPLVPARVLRRAVAVSATVVAAFVTHASGAPVPVVPAQSGLTEPGAIVRSPDDALWTTSPEMGVCRISPGAAPRPIEGTYCGDELRQGPKEPLGMAFDRRSSSFFVADGGANSGGVWRMHWSPATGMIDAAVRIAHLGEDRATGLALAPTGPIGSDGKHANEVYLTTKGSTAVLRIADPQGAAAAPAVAGHARGAGASSLAVLDGDLYIAEDIEPDDDPTFPPPIVATNGVSRLSLDTGGTAVAVRGLDGGLSHAVAADPVRGRVYMGTATGDLVDHVDVLDVDSGRVETYETGFTSVSAMGVEADGDLLVADDPGAGALVVDSAGMGRIWRVGLQTLDRPAPAITAGPPVTSNHTRASFAYTSRAGALFECRLDGAAYAGCPGAGAGSVSYDALMEGVHAFDVRAVDPAPGSTPGRSLRRTFIVDLTAPSVGIDSRLDGEHRPGVPIVLEFSAGEHGVAFGCSLDGAAPEPCSSGWTMTPVRLGAHEVRVEGVDLAGNASSPSDPAAVRRFVVTAAPPAPTAPAAPTTATAPAALPAAPVPAAPRPAPRTRARSGRAQQTTIRVVRTAGLRVAPGARPVVNVLFDATPGARFARLTLRDFEGGARVRVLARTDLRVSPGERVRMMWPLDRRQARRLHAGRYRLTVAMGPRRSALSTVWTGVLRVRRGA